MWRAIFFTFIAAGTTFCLTTNSKTDEPKGQIAVERMMEATGHERASWRPLRFSDVEVLPGTNTVRPAPVTLFAGANSHADKNKNGDVCQCASCCSGDGS